MKIGKCYKTICMLMTLTIALTNAKGINNVKYPLVFNEKNEYEDYVLESFSKLPDYIINELLDKNASVVIVNDENFAEKIYVDFFPESSPNTCKFN